MEQPGKAASAKAQARALLRAVAPPLAALLGALAICAALSTWLGLAALAICFCLVALIILSLNFLLAAARRRARDMAILRAEKDALAAALALAQAAPKTPERRAHAQLLADMSHELRTPLNAILGFSEIIFSRTFHTDIDKHYEYAELIHGSGQKLLAMLNMVLDLSKIEAGRYQLRDSHLDLGRAIEDAVQMMAAKAQASDCALTMEVEENLPPVLVDEYALQQILGNLLSNAVKFTPKGGCVLAFARRAPDGAIHFGVADTGVGIASADQAQMLGDCGAGQDVKIGHKAKGLGFPLVRGLIELHGGSLVLDSVQGEGTRVTAILPAVRVRARPVVAEKIPA